MRRKAPCVLAACLLIATLASIWDLTVQTPSETMGLSGWWANLLAGTGLVDAGTASFIVRKLAHTGEFFPVGVFAALLVFSVLKDRLTFKSALMVCAAFCIACSLTDQVHKLFVPGREFDALDLVFDALGYSLGIAAACGMRWVWGKNLLQRFSAD